MRFIPAIIMLLTPFLFQAQNPVDTIRVQAFKHSSKTRDTLLQFPDVPDMTYRKILLKYNMRCRGGLVLKGPEDGKTGCGEWDYSCNTFIVDSQTVEKIPATHPEFTISGFNDTAFAFTTQQTYVFRDFNQKQVDIQNVNSEASVQIGNGAQSLDLLGSGNRAGRMQIFLPATDLITNGLSAGQLNGIALYVESANGQLGHFRVGIQSTMKNDFHAGDFTATGFQEVYFRDINTQTGLNKIYFHTPYNWDGVSNLILDISFTNQQEQTPILFRSTQFPDIRTLTSDNCRALDVTGEGYVHIATDMMNGIHNELTISFWAKGNMPQLPVYNSIVYAYSQHPDQRQFNVHLPWDNQVYFDCGFSENGFDRIQKVWDQDNLIRNQWTHWTFTKNAATGEMLIFVNGTLWQSGLGKTRTIQILHMILGRLGEKTNRLYSGQIRDFTVWEKALPASTIQEWLHKRLDATHPNWASLTAWYPLQEGQGNIVTDARHGLTSQGVDLLWDFERGDQLRTTFIESALAPNLILFQGDYDRTVSDITVRYPHPNVPRIVRQYQIISHEGTLPLQDDEPQTIEQWHYFDTTPQPVYDGNSNTLLTQIPVTSEGTINTGQLSYTRRFPFYHELVSFVTPYGINLDLGPEGKTWYFDMTDYVHLLKGPRRLLMTMGGQWQEEMDLEFLFISGTPPWEVLQYEQLWQGGARLGGIGIKQIIDGTVLQSKPVAFHPDAATFKIKSTITGHGAQGEFHQNGGLVSHSIWIDQNKAYEWTITQNCTENPIFPQGGTWVYNRQGWCPGERSLTRETDISEYIDPQVVMAFDYRTSNPPNPSGDYRYIVAHQLVGYSVPNFEKDASLEWIKNPNNSHAEYGRTNPFCERPVVVVRNTGNAFIQSIKFEYWINDAQERQQHTWTGFLNPSDFFQVRLPMQALWQHGIQPTDNRIHIRILEVNGSPDDYVDNNYLSSSFALADNQPGALKVQLRTNNFPQETSFSLFNGSGTAIDNKSFSQANQIFAYTYNLPDGCYRLRVNDTGGDGLQWWANSAQGSGWIRLLSDPDNNVLKTFTPDFGGGFDYYFTVGSPVHTEQWTQELEITLFPNPAQDNFSLQGESLQNARVTIIDLLGRTFYSQVSPFAFLNVNTQAAGMTAGIYLVRIEKERESSSLRLIVVD